MQIPKLSRPIGLYILDAIIGSGATSEAILSIGSQKVKALERDVVQALVLESALPLVFKTATRVDIPGRLISYSPETLTATIQDVRTNEQFTGPIEDFAPEFALPKSLASPETLPQYVDLETGNDLKVIGLTTFGKLIVKSSLTEPFTILNLSDNPTTRVESSSFLRPICRSLSTLCERLVVLL